MDKFKPSAAPFKKVKRVQFSVLSPHEIRQQSVVEVKYPETIESGAPKAHGLADPRLGTTVREWNCATCDGDIVDCPGHWGHLELARPMFQIHFMPTVLKVLRSVCFRCSKLLCDDNDDQFIQSKSQVEPKEKLQLVYECARTKKVCSSDEDAEITGADEPDEDPFSKSKKKKKKFRHGGCGAPQPKISRTGLTLEVEWKAAATQSDDQRKRVLSAADVYDILKGISNEDCAALGLNPRFSRPDWMILTVFPISPPQIRPTIMVDSAKRGEDDLTYKLADIIKANARVKQHIETGAPEHVVREYEQVLQFHISTFVNNEQPGRPQAVHRSGRPLKTLVQRMKGKEGRVRGNLMGKRVDFSARSVITPDPLLSIDQVGVPRIMAMKLSYPEIVTPFNIKKMRELMMNGPEIYPGALYVIRDDGTRIDLRFTESRDINLNYGYKVERHVLDDDWIIFNRQPSLHRMSMMGHRVKVMPYSTFRLNLSVTTPYNADFDGDEMNMHVAQSLETRAEIAEIMLVPKQIITPKANRPVIGIVQDALLGCSLFTRRDVFLKKDLVMNILMWVPNWNGELPKPAILKPEELWTGKQIFSLILPQVNLESKSNHHNAKKYGDQHNIADSEVFVNEGEVLAGVLDKGALGTSEGGLIHIIWIEQGPERAKLFLNQTQRVVNYWLLQRAYTIGVSDTIADNATITEISEIIGQAKAKVDEFIIQLYQNELKRKPGMSLMATFESNVNKELNQGVDDAGNKAMQSLSRANNINTMVNSGSKGQTVNISQIMACVGQQNVEGKRIPFGFQQRTLPHFPKNDYGAESRGFVSNSYLTGLTPQEFFFHTMGGREGIIDTAVKTAETGYIQRRLVKAMEDTMVNYDRTVRNSLGDVVQFLYGEDAMDSVAVEKQGLASMKMDNKRLETTFKYDFESPTLGLPRDVLDDNTIETVRANLDSQLLLVNEFKQIRDDREWLRTKLFPTLQQDAWPLPVNLSRLIWNTQKRFGINKYSTTDLDPVEVVHRVQKLQQELSIVNTPKPGAVMTPDEELLNRITREVQDNATVLFNIHLRSTLASKRVINEHRLSSKAFHFLIEEIESRFQLALAHPGEMVGAVAAQSIGEPATQMTLNTFHFAGISAKNVTLGVPRLKELINIAKNPKTPGMTVYLKGESAKDATAAMAVLNKLEYLTLRKLVNSTQIYYDPKITETVIPEDEELIQIEYAVGPDEDEIAKLSPWLLRVELARDLAIVDKKLKMSQLTDTIDGYFRGNLNTLANDETADTPVLRLRIKLDSPSSDDGGREEGGTNSQTGEGDDELLRFVESKLLDDMHLGGVPGVEKVFMQEEKLVVIDPATGGIPTQPEKVWILDTEGTNLSGTLACQGVDSTKTTSNDIVEIFTVLGVEGARAALLNEIRRVIGFYGIYVNYRHIALLVDVMTHRGFLMAITRHGINRQGTGPLARSSFEETAEMFTEAASFAEEDLLRGVSENIMLGNTGPLGTNSFELLLDYNLLQKAVVLQTERIGGLEMEFDYDQPSSPLAYDPRASPGPTSPMLSSSPYVGSAVFSPYSSGGAFSPSSPYSPASPGNYSPSSPRVGASPASPSYSPAGTGGYSPTSPRYSPTSPAAGYSPTSPRYSPTSPAAGYSPTSPRYSPTSPGYSPTSPRYSPTSPGAGYSPTSPRYSPTSPGYSPTSPRYSPTSPRYSPTSPRYSPTSPGYSPTSPRYSPTTPAAGYSPSSPRYSPSSPQYSPSGAPAAYSPTSATYSPTSPTYSPSNGPAYSPSSPKYSPSNNG